MAITPISSIDSVGLTNAINSLTSISYINPIEKLKSSEDADIKVNEGVGLSFADILQNLINLEKS